MKKIILIIFALVPAFAIAQSFKLSPNGFVSAVDTSKNYVVIDIQTESQSKLYSKSLLYFTKTYASPQDVISKVDNEVITINGFQRGAIRQNGTAAPFDINYTVVFQFKDGKIKIDAPSFKLNTGLRTMYLVYTGFSMNGQEVGVYGKGGKVKSEKAIIDLEKFFNDYIEKYKKYLAEKSDW